MTSFEIAFIATLARGAFIVMVLLTAEFALRRFLTAGCRRMLWCICAVWLVVPQPNSRSLPWQVDFSRLNYRMKSAVANHAPQTAQTLRSIVAPVREAARASQAPTAKKSFFRTGWIWQWRSHEGLLFLLAGLPGCLWLLWKYLRCRRQVRHLPPVDDPRVLEAWARISGTPKRLKLLNADSMGLNPTLFGFFHQNLLLPLSKLRQLTGKELELLLEHEYCHYRAGDGYLNMLTLAISRFFWFNPLLILVRRRLRRSCELHCDERVLRRHPESIRTYGNLLLRFAGAPTPPAVAMGLSEAPRELSQRIRSMVRGLPTTNKARAGRASVLLLILLLSCPVFLVAVNTKPRFTPAPKVVRRANPDAVDKPVLPHLMLEYAFSPKSGVMRWKINYSPDFPLENSQLTLWYGGRKITRDLTAKPEYIELEMKRDLENLQFTYNAILGKESLTQSFALPMADNNRFAGQAELQANRSVPLFEMLPFDKLDTSHISWNGSELQRLNTGWNFRSEYSLYVSLSVPGLDAGSYQSPDEDRAEARMPILLIERDLNLDVSSSQAFNPALVKASEELRLLEYELAQGGVSLNSVLEARERVINLELQKLESVDETKLTPRWQKYRENITRELQENLLKRTVPPVETALL